MLYLIRLLSFVLLYCVLEIKLCFVLLSFHKRLLFYCWAGSIARLETVHVCVCVCVCVWVCMIFMDSCIHLHTHIHTSWAKESARDIDIYRCWGEQWKCRSVVRDGTLGWCTKWDVWLMRTTSWHVLARTRVRKYLLGIDTPTGSDFADTYLFLWRSRW